MQPSLTMGIDWDRGRLTGEIDGREAVGQAVKLALETPRWEYPIFSGDYGSEVQTLFGKHRDLIRGEAERLITEALTQDDRVKGVGTVRLEFTGDEVKAGFAVDTIFGEIERVTAIEL